MKPSKIMPDAEMNRIFMDGLREFLGMDPISYCSFSAAGAKKNNAKGKKKVAS